MAGPMKMRATLAGGNTAAAVGLLTIYDMVKAMDRGMTLGELRLEEKLGGKSGVFRRSER